MEELLTKKQETSTTAGSTAVPPEMSQGLVLLFSLACGLSVANIYFGA